MTTRFIDFNGKTKSSDFNVVNIKILCNFEIFPVVLLVNIRYTPLRTSESTCTYHVYKYIIMKVRSPNHYVTNHI